MRTFIAILIPIILLSTMACPRRPNKNGPPSSQEPTPRQEPANETSTQPAGIGAGLPFGLTIGGRTVHSSLKLNIPEGQGVTIQVTSSISSGGVMKVIHPGGDSLVIGTWQANAAQFYYKFPYGENRLVITLGGKDYEVMVIAGAQSTGAGSTVGCEGGYLDIGPNSVWNYEETTKDKFPEDWVYRITEWARSDTGAVSFKLVTESTSGVEKKVDSTATLDLICRDGTVFINRAVEIEKGIKSTTRYDANTIYMPQAFSDGMWWQRQGILEVQQESGDTESYDIAEKFSWVGKEHIKVKAGEFDADKVTYSISRKGKGEEFNYEGTTWYVPGLGRVLSEAEIDSSPRMELVSYQGVTAR